MHCNVSSRVDAPQEKQERSAMKPLQTACSRVTIGVTFTALILGSPIGIGAQETPVTMVQRAATALGGAAALRGLTNATLEYHSATFGLGQEETPMSPARATFAVVRTVNDYRGDRRLLTQQTRAVTGAMTQTRRVITPTIATTATNDGAPSVDNPAAVAAALAEMRARPERMILFALDNPSQLTAEPPKRIRGELMDGVRIGNGPDASIYWFDRLSHLPVGVERVTDDRILGDRSTLQIFTRWEDAGGLLFARQVDTEVNGRLQQHLLVTSVTTNAALMASEFTIADSLMARAQPVPATPPPPPPITVQLAELAPNVWRAEGGTHHSLVVRQGNALLVVEAPQSAARSKAVLDTLRGRFPIWPVRTFVATHHHWDHAGGVREYLAQGIDAVVHARNVDFVRGIGAARKTVAPDALSRGGRMPNVRAANPVTILGAGETAVQLIELPTAHVQGMLAAYVPSARILFVSDVITPGPTLAPSGAREIVAMVRARGITVDRVVGGHGGISAWADVERAAR
jgi:glyoxylase-like metal-dependent hydrolase (beta-lactamase superfamily II)